MTITLQIPHNLEKRLEHVWGDLPRKALEAIAVEGYRDETFSRGQVGELLGLNRLATEDFLKAHGVTRHYDLADLDKDLAANRSLLGDTVEA